MGMAIGTFLHRFRSRLAFGILLPLLAVVTWQFGHLLSRPVSLPLCDYVEYWSAGRLCAAGQNPYARDNLLNLQREVGWEESGPLMMWNPPWTLPLVVPFAVIDFKESHIIWLFTQFLVLALCVHRLCGIYRLQGSRLWLVLLISVTFMPGIVALSMSQITPLVLLGLVGFLHFTSGGVHTRRSDCLDILAGASSSLIAIKPHLAHLFWIGLLFWSMQQRRWFVPVGLITGLTVLSAIALSFDPPVFTQYFDALHNHPPENWIMPTLGTVLRQCCGWEYFWLQFVPPLAGGLWFVIYWWRRRDTWDWCEQLPLIIIVSLLTSPYGAWTVDMLILLIPLLQMASRRAALPVALLYIVIDGIALNQKLSHADEFKFLWIVPAVLFIYLIAMRSLRPSALTAVSNS
jgi:hypothetical protein